MYNQQDDLRQVKEDVTGQSWPEYAQLNPNAMVAGGDDASLGQAVQQAMPQQAPDLYDQFGVQPEQQAPEGDLYRQFNTNQVTPEQVAAERNRMRQEQLQGSGTEAFLANVGSGLDQLYQGGKQIAAGTGLIDKDQQQKDYQAFVERQNNMGTINMQHPVAGFAGEMVGQTLPFAALPGGAGAGAVAKSAIQGAKIGALSGGLQPTQDGSYCTSTCSSW